MKLPSCTVRTRSTAGLKVIVSVMVVTRVAPEIESGTLYGPPPTRNGAVGGARMTCADPMPGDVIGASGVGCAAAAGGVASGGVPGGVAVAGGLSSVVTFGGWVGGVVGGGIGVGGDTSTVP